MNRFVNFVRRNRAMALGLFVAFLLAGLLLRNLCFPERDPRVEAARNQGYPTTLTELDAWYRSVPPADNAALLYTQAMALPFFSGSNGPTADALAILPSRGQPLAAGDKQTLIALFATNQAVLNLLHSASALSASRYPIDLKQGWLTELPHLPKLKRAVSLLGASALFHADNCEWDQAVRDLASAARAADSLREEPLIISQLVRFACWGIVLTRLERVVSLGALTDEQLASLQNSLAAAEPNATLVRALAGEQAQGIAFFTDSREQAKLLDSVKSGPPNNKERWQFMFLVSVLKSSGLLRKDKATYLDIMAANLAAGRQPYPERVAAGRQVGAMMPGKFCIFSQMMLPALSRFFLRDSDHAARVRDAQTALAVERFRLAHTNALPECLDALVPAFLRAVPADPYDGKPLRFKKLATGYVVYSIGSDGRDDGGLERNPKNQGAGADITFFVER